MWCLLYCFDQSPVFLQFKQGQKWQNNYPKYKNKILGCLICFKIFLLRFTVTSHNSLRRVSRTQSLLFQEESICLKLLLPCIYRNFASTAFENHLPSKRVKTSEKSEKWNKLDSYIARLSGMWFTSVTIF